MVSHGRVRFLAALIATLSTLALASTPATAVPADPATPGVQAAIDAYLTRAPGGHRINATELSYGNGTFIVTFARSTTGLTNTATGADCPSGWFCFYDGVNYEYPRGRLSSCGWQDLAWWGWNDRTEAVHYNLPTGSVSFYNQRLKADHSDDQYLFFVGASSRYLSDVTPYRNMADHVYRYC